MPNLNETEKKKMFEMNRMAKLRKELYDNPKLADLFLEITFMCNAECEHCGSRCGGPGGGKPINELTTNEWKAALKDVAENFDADEILLNVTGGEPLMRKDLFEIMAYASGLGFRWGIVTNGTLITDEVIDKMLETGMETIAISVDGLGENHDSFRHIKGAFVKIETAIKKLLKLPQIQLLEVVTTANKKNIGQLKEIYDWIKRMGIKSWRLMNIDSIGRAKNNDDLLLNALETQYLLLFIQKCRLEGIVDVDFACSHYVGLEFEKEVRPNYFMCLTGVAVASILHNGDIFVCPNVERRPEFIQGNVRTDSFGYVWKNKFMPFRRISRTCNETCKKCNDFEFCAGDAFHTWNFDDNKPNWCIKEIFKKEKK